MRQILNQFGLFLTENNWLHLIPLFTNIAAEGFLLKWFCSDSLFTLDATINESLTDVQNLTGAPNAIVSLTSKGPNGLPVAALTGNVQTGIPVGTPAGIPVGKSVDGAPSVDGTPIGKSLKSAISGGYLNKKQSYKILKDSCRSIFN